VIEVGGISGARPTSRFATALSSSAENGSRMIGMSGGSRLSISGVERSMFAI